MRDQRHGRLVEAEGAIVIMASTVFAFDLFAVLPLLPQTPVGRGPEAVLLVPLFFTVRSWLIATLIVPVGAVLDKFGPRILVPVACIVKAGGFWLASSATDELGFLAAAAALGLGTAVTRPAMKSVIAAIRQRSPGSQLFAGQNIATNVAAIGGPAAAQAAVLMGMSEQMFLLLIALEVGWRSRCCSRSGCISSLDVETRSHLPRCAPRCFPGSCPSMPTRCWPVAR
ncbi:MAG: hypothetical protein HC869_00425 [Rhodospirillales bacterium]|nr:hypothetical protein [Rhodospirillales bacterium]